MKAVDQIIPLILKCVEQEAAQENSNRVFTKGVYRASSVGECIRKSQYERLGYTPEPIAPETHLIFRDGHMHHNDLRALLGKVGVLSSVESTISKKYKHKGQSFTITGTIDGIWNDILFDVKSINFFRYQSLDKNFPTDYMNYVYQHTLYMDMLKRKLAIFIFKDKNTGRLKIKTVKFDPLVLEEALDRIVEIQLGVKNKKLIDRPYPNSDWHCKKCIFRMSCRKLPMERSGW